MDNFILFLKKLIYVVVSRLHEIYKIIFNLYISQTEIKKQYDPLILKKETQINELSKQLQNHRKKHHELETSLETITKNNEILKEKIETMQELLIEK